MFPRVSFSLCLLLALNVSAHIGGWAKEPEQADLQPVAVIPFKYENNRIRLTATLNGDPLSMLLDTGASTTVLFANMEEAIKRLPISGDAAILFPALDQTFNGKRLAPVSIDIGNKTINLQKVILLDDKSNMKARRLVRYDGILGREFFSGYTVEVDPKDQKIRLYPQGTDLGPQYRTLHKLYMQDGAPHIRFRTKMPWETSPSMKQMLVDTGYPGTIVFWDSIHYRKAARLTPEVYQHEESVAIVGRARFKFGRLTFLHTPVFLGALPPKQAGKRDGLIGGTIINSFSYAIDLTGARMWMLAKHEGNNYSRQIDGTFYPPNDEPFVFSDFPERLSASPKITIEVD